MSMKAALFVALAGFAIFYLLMWWATVKDGLPGLRLPSALQTLIGFVTNFFDTLGIGSFATTTSMFRFFKTVPDHLIPGTLNIGHTPATIAQAFIYIAIIQVDMTTLVALITAAVIGSWLGAGIVSTWPVQKVRIGMGIALLVAATLFLMQQFNLMPKGGDTLGLEGGKLFVGVAGNFVLGALMSLGIGLYGPCMILIYMLGMVPTAAFPIMMGSCAFDVSSAIGLALGGIPGVLIAAYIVKSLPLEYVRWLVIIVVVYTAVSMLRAAKAESARAAG
jgi:uncharacterized membrane protein YfcA